MAKSNYFTWHPPLLFLKRIFCVVILVFFSNLQSQVIHLDEESTIKKDEVSRNSTSKNQLDGIYISGEAFVFDEGTVLTSVKTNPPAHQKKHIKKNKKQLLAEGNKENIPQNKSVNTSQSNKNQYTLPISRDFFSTGKSSLVFAPPSTNSFSFELIIFKTRNFTILGINDRKNNHLYSSFYRRSYFNEAAAIRPPPFS